MANNPDAAAISSLTSEEIDSVKKLILDRLNIIKAPTGSGKKIDYALRNPIFVEKIDSYELPTEDDLLLQSIDRLICESCVYAEQCYGEPCLANPECRAEMRSALFALLKREK